MFHLDRSSLRSLVRLGLLRAYGAAVSPLRSAGLDLTPSPLSASLCTARPTVQTSAFYALAARAGAPMISALLIAAGSFAKKKKGSPQRKAFLLRYATTRNTAPQSSRSLE